MKNILMNTEMIKAILEGRKTQTRRVITEKELYKMHSNEAGVCNGKIMQHEMCQGMPDGSGGYEVDHWEEDMTEHYSKYQKDEIIYVAEEYIELDCMDFSQECESEDHNGSQENCFSTYAFKVNDLESYDLNDYNEILNYSDERWKSAETMPKEYARIFLKVIDVRVERLQDISLSDCQKEGFYGYIADFAYLFDSTVPKGYKWEDNPYVFVYEFERVENEH